MIVLFTDFGLDGPYIGQVKAVLYQRAPNTPVIDLFSNAPLYNPGASAHLLAAYSKGFPKDTVFLAVVDPGVGSASRKPVIVRADDYWFVGPDNALFSVIASRAHILQAWYVSWEPRELSASFHGRDLFAPIAAELACGKLPSDEFLQPAKIGLCDELLEEVIYIDHFGNLITGIHASNIDTHSSFLLNQQRIKRLRTFSDAPVGSPFIYENSNGLLEVAVNQGRADTYFNASIGTAIIIESDATV